MFFGKGLNIHGVHEFKCEKDEEDKCVIWHIEKGFQDLEKVNIKDESKQFKNDLHCRNKSWYIKSHLHFLLLISRYDLSTLSVKVQYFWFVTPIF